MTSQQFFIPMPWIQAYPESPLSFRRSQSLFNVLQNKPSGWASFEGFIRCCFTTDLRTVHVFIYLFIFIEGEQEVEVNQL